MFSNKLKLLGEVVSGCTCACVAMKRSEASAGRSNEPMLEGEHQTGVAEHDEFNKQSSEFEVCKIKKL